ncbi:MAG: hypothetical protein NVSMB62_23840 [Acidobacteriaceae bacterium]
MTFPTLKASRWNLKQFLPALPLAVVACATALPAQTPPPAATRPSAAKNPARSTPPINRNVVVLDPSHGGPEPGARLTDQAVEKDVTLAISSRLRQALTAAGFTIVSTRDADPQAALTTDQRAELANRQHAAACLILHATSTGSGMHLYISGVQPTPAPLDTDPDNRPAFEPIPWEMAQAGSVTQSLHLQTQIFTALNSAGLATLRGRGHIRPLDNLTCPAVVIEIAPLGPAASSRTAVTDSAYQQRLVQAITAALQHWRDSIPTRQKPTPPPAPRPASAAGGPK